MKNSYNASNELSVCQGLNDNINPIKLSPDRKCIAQEVACDIFHREQKIKSYHSKSIIKKNSSCEPSDLMYLFSELTEDNITDSESSNDSQISLSIKKNVKVKQVEFASQKIRKPKRTACCKAKTKKKLNPIDYYHYVVSEPRRIKPMDELVQKLREKYI